MNKYKAAARQSQKHRRLVKMCLGKTRYETEAEAIQKGQRHYACPHCKGWHRSGQLAELIAACRKRSPRLPLSKSPPLPVSP